MKNILYFFLLTSLFVSCDKDDKPDPVPVVQEQTLLNLSYGTDPAHKMDLYLPQGRTDTTKLIIMVHGGAWTAGDKADFNTYVPVIKQRLPGYAIANINYRLATPLGNHFPTQENDMKAAVDFLVQKSSEYKISQKFVLLGASAGAHMALLQAYKQASPDIKAVIDFFGPSDMTEMYNSAPAGSFTQTALQILLQGTPTSNPTRYNTSSPINYVSAQSPPTLMLHGSTDDLVPVSQSEALRTKLLTQGVVNELVIYPNVGHEIWPAVVMTDAFTRIQNFIQANVD